MPDRPKNWSQRLDDQIMEQMRRLPAPPLWLMLGLELLALAAAIVMLVWWLWR